MDIQGGGEPTSLPALLQRVQLCTEGPYSSEVAEDEVDMDMLYVAGARLRSGRMIAQGDSPGF
jgi:hypothetical protein